MPSASLPEAPLTARVRAYWNDHIHDLAITSHPVGSPGFFQDLDEYHFDKLHHLCSSSRSTAFAASGCWTSAAGRAWTSCGLPRAAPPRSAWTWPTRPSPGARRISRSADWPRKLVVGRRRASAAGRSVRGLRVRSRRRAVHRRRPARGGRSPSRVAARRRGRLPGLQPHLLAQRAVEADEVGSRTRGAPVLRKYSPDEFRRLLGGFSDVRLVFERFPVKSRLHGGWKGLAFNTMFVGTFNALPRSWVERLRMAPAGVLPEVDMLPFSKAHAYGNDFLYVRAADLTRPIRPGRHAPLRSAHRHRRRRVDHLRAHSARRVDDAANADGGKAELSGNGLRALAALIIRERQRQGRRRPLGRRNPDDGRAADAAAHVAGRPALRLRGRHGPAGRHS